MKRFGLVLTLFTIAFVFTQCRNYTGQGCGNNNGNTQIINGLNNIKTEFIGPGFPSIEMTATNTYANKNIKFNLFMSAYADCLYIPELIDFNPWIDSIKVTSSPEYNSLQLVKQLYITTNSSPNYFTLNEYNSQEVRILEMTEYEPIMLELTSLPTQSDSFTFSFFYYKDGAIIDSSFTQKFHISN